MTTIDLSSRDADDIIDGGAAGGRADLASVVAITAFLRASRDVEPAPPMRADLAWLIDGRSSPAPPVN